MNEDKLGLGDQKNQGGIDPVQTRKGESNMNMTGKKVLVVDDEKDLITYLSTYLSDQGFIVEAAEDGNTALNKVKQSRPDLITLDIVMPEKTGVKFYRELKTAPATADIPVIIITGLKPDFEKFISNRRQVPPPEGYLSKPFEQKDLLKLIESVLAKTSPNAKKMEA